MLQVVEHLGGGRSPTAVGENIEIRDNWRASGEYLSAEGLYGYRFPGLNLKVPLAGAVTIVGNSEIGCSALRDLEQVVDGRGSEILYNLALDRLSFFDKFGLPSFDDVEPAYLLRRVGAPTSAVGFVTRNYPGDFHLWRAKTGGELELAKSQAEPISPSEIDRLLRLRGGLSRGGLGHAAPCRTRHVPRMGLFDVLWPSSPVIAATVEDICRADGWDVKCTIGLQAASGLRSRAEDRTGAPLSASIEQSTAGDVGLQFSVAFDLEPGADPGSRFTTQGNARLLSESRYLSTSPATGTWQATSRDDDEVPTAIRWSLQCAEVTVSGGTVVADGTTLFFTALTTAERRERGLDVGNGRVAIREDSSMLSALFGTRGLIEEFKTIGRFEIKRRESSA